MAVDAAQLIFVADIPPRYIGKDLVDPKAVTTGIWIRMEKASYQPMQVSYFELLAHEVTHVWQHLADPNFKEKYDMQTNAKGYWNNDYEQVARIKGSRVADRIAAGFKGCCE